MAYDKLVLHPLNPRAILHDPLRLVEVLRDKGLIGRSFGWCGDVHYRTGHRFQDLVSFRRKTGTGPDECHLSVMETAEEPAFLGAAHSHSPRCPWCRRAFTAWMAALRTWQKSKGSNSWTCPACGATVPVEELDWSHSGGIARYALDIWGVAPSAAVPSPELLELLQDVTLERWDYFYYRLGVSTSAQHRSSLQAP